VAGDLPISSGSAGVTGVSALLAVETGDWSDGVGFAVGVTEVGVSKVGEEDAGFGSLRV
jgi:hypothetical protein